jgi:hypothetical protein
LSRGHFALRVSAASVNQKGLKARLANLLEPPLDAPARTLCRVRSFLDGFARQYFAHGDQTPADPSATFTNTYTNLKVNGIPVLARFGRYGVVNHRRGELQTETGESSSV